MYFRRQSQATSSGTPSVDSVHYGYSVHSVVKEFAVLFKSVPLPVQWSTSQLNVQSFEVHSLGLGTKDPVQGSIHA